MSGSFVVLLVGMFSSVIVFVIELILHRHQKQQKSASVILFPAEQKNDSNIGKGDDENVKQNAANDDNVLTEKIKSPIEKNTLTKHSKP